MAKNLFTISLLFSSLTGVGQAQTAEDSVRYGIPDVYIRASKTSSHASASAAFESEIPEVDLLPLKGLSVDRAIRRGGMVFIRDRGGNGSIKTIGLRGNEAAQTLVLLDGFPLNSAQNGIVDLALYPTDLIGHVGIIRGSQSALFGSGGIGGAVHLSTRAASQFRPALSGTIGSFGQRAISGTVPFGLWGGSVGLQAGAERATDNFTYDRTVPGGVETTDRQGNDYRKAFALARGDFPVGTGTRMQAIGMLVDARRGSPGPATTAEPLDAVLSDRLAQAGLRLVGGKGRIEWETGAFLVGHTQRYQEAHTTSPVDETYKNLAFSWTSSGSYNYSEGHTFNAGIEAGAYRVSSRTIAFPVPRRALAIRYSSRHAVTTGGLVLYPSIRIDTFSDLQPQASGKLASHVPLLGTEALVFRGGVGTGFRTPTFNERYWVPGGNPGLRNERSLMVEAGLSSRFPAVGIHTLSMLGHWSVVQDHIIGWPPENVGKTRLLGAELGWSWQPVAWVESRTAGALADARSVEPDYPGRQIPYIPRITASHMLTFTVAGTRTTTAVEYSSRRFTTIDNIRALSSAPYTVVSVALQIPAPSPDLPLSFSCFLDNVLDASYEIVRNYPMPGRSIRVSITWELP